MDRISVRVMSRAFHVLVVGAGGTGGYVLADLARLAYGVSDARLRITVVDGDRVEEKNLLRQHFVPPDLGKLKVEVLAARYGNAFGLNISYCGEYVESEEALADMLYCMEPSFLGQGFYEEYLPVIVGCVDNNRTRQLFHSLFMSGKFNRIAYIDAGNGVHQGQVAIGYRQYGVCIPPVGEWFPDILSDTETRFPSQASCANVSVTEPQSFLANRMAATLVMGLLTNLIVDNELTAYLLTFDCQTGTAKPRFITEDVFERRIA